MKRGDSVNSRYMSFSEQLLAMAVNQLRVLAWHNTEDGQKGRNAPEPILLPEQAMKKAEDYAKNFTRAHQLKKRLSERENSDG